MNSQKKTATIYRKTEPFHLCPFGLKAYDLLKRNGYKVDDHPITSREEQEAKNKEFGVETTPQVFINDVRIGGYSELRAFFGKGENSKVNGSGYQPVIALFSITFLMAIAASIGFPRGDLAVSLFEYFVAFSMCALAIQKLQNLFQFTNMFITYDLVGMRYVPYAYIYPFVEGIAGALMVGGVLTYIAAPAALTIATIGAISVFKAVYIDKRDLKCACVGGGTNVPLGFTALTENLMMMAMSIWMLAKGFAV